ncbi:MAG TPA: serine/threonine-protein kinase [Candidatus Omnitrophota bacterium]|nr:serine/threonine-protein kinase [Candidatus Omnitrophota bacterium]
MADDRSTRSLGAPTVSAVLPAPEPGPVLFVWGPLQVLERVGEGAGGEVYRAFDPGLRTEVALKLLKPGASWSPAARDRFQGEARKLAQVRHPNVLAVHGVGEHDGRMGIWTDFIRGCSLEEYIRREGALEAGEAARIGMDLCRALAAVHARGLVHCDVKASNVMREQGGRILLMDFGCVAELRSAAGMEACVEEASGTPVAMAPERLRGAPATARGDVYGLGVLLYRLVTCRYPVEGRSVSELLRLHERGAGVSLSDRRPDLPPGFVQVVDRALSPEPSRRYPSAGAMGRALTTTLEAPGTGVRRLVARSVGMAALAVAGLVAVSWLIGSRSPHQDVRPDSTRPAATSAPGNAPRAAKPLQASASLFRHLDARDEPLPSGATVVPGDRLFLEVSSEQPMHTYVLDEDEAGDVYGLFPIPGLEASNPLSSRVRHLLPGAAGDSLAYWTVTSFGGRERIVVIGSRSPRHDVEEMIARVPSAVPGRPIRLVSIEARENVRGIGGIEKQRAFATTHRKLDEMLRALEARRQDSGDVWIWRVELRNPAPHTNDAKTAR